MRNSRSLGLAALLLVLLSVALFLLPLTRRNGERVDVIVVGGGPAGLAAAREARDAGASVLLVERGAELGGRARYGGGATLMAGTSTQAGLGIKDSPEKALSEWQAMTGSPPGEWARAYLTRAPAEVHDWLARRGGGWDATGLYDLTAGTQRLHMAKGGSRAYVEALTKGLDCQVLLRTEVRSLVVRRGRSCSVTYTAGERGGTAERSAGAIVLATGGFAADAARLRAVRAAAGDLLVVPEADAEGDATSSGLRMLEGAGASLVNMDAVGCLPQILNELDDQGKPVILNLSRALWLDGAGNYFIEGHKAYSVSAGAGVLHAPGRKVWALFDDTQARMAFPGSPPPAVERLTSKGKSALKAGSLEALARRMGLDPPAMERELARGAALVVSGALHRPRGFLAPAPLEKPPFYAVRVGLVASKCFGGVKTDGEGRVLDRRGAPLPGLYAAGEVAGMAGGGIGAPKGFDGSLGAVFFSGRIAGRKAAEFARKR